jgi:hypothetical protein
MWFKSAVLPAPRKPESTVMGNSGWFIAVRKSKEFGRRAGLAAARWRGLMTFEPRRRHEAALCIKTAGARVTDGIGVM